ncbi:MAG: ABC transporter ATP-binding protein [Spirochaetaceae bacterium]|nr:MAG: ABC transporter ATP-binding protein [Spirochaetaceae bacterium]
MSSIEIDRVSKAYDGPLVVDSLSLCVPSGTVFGLLGPSGCGKTTTLRMIAGLLQPDSGDIRFDGVSVLAVPPERRAIGMVFQQHLLFPHMNVEQNVSFGLRMQGVRPAASRSRVDEALDLVRLGGTQRRYPAQLSGGQQQRVALARAVVTNPAVLLLDEPLSNLDTRLREEMRALIRSVQRRLGITTIVVTHDQGEAMELSDQMAVMFDGAIAQVGRPAELYARPDSARIARFLGATNLIPAQVVDTTAVDLMRIDTPFGSLDVCPGNSAPTTGSPRVVASIRCEHVAIVDRHIDGPTASGVSTRDGARNIFTGLIDDVVVGAGRITYAVDVRGTRITAVEVSDAERARGSTVQVRLPCDRVRLLPFDPDLAGR